MFINKQIAKEYLIADGKTKALFGIKEILEFGYQYYVIILGAVALIFAIISIKSSSEKGKIIVAVILSLVSIIVVFERIWKLII